MKLDTVQIQNFRNIDSVSINPSECINFLFGSNGSGKSSFLEAIHYLGFGRSFRTNKHSAVINTNSESFSVFSKCKTGSIEQLRLGISRGRADNCTVSVNGERSKKIADLVRQIPVQVFTPQSSDLIIGSPGLRRRYLDWGLFHVEQSFEHVSNSYKKLLKHKNALLKNAQLNVLKDGAHNAYWDDQLVEAGESLTTLRKAFLERLKPHIYRNLSQFLPEILVEISYHRGWEKDASLKDSIEKKKAKDSKFGFLSVGPHKADLRFRVNGANAAEVLSRGQLRMLVAALQLAETQCLMDDTGKTSVFLLDDVGAELDVSKREKFIDALLAQDAQLFVTAIEKEQVMFIDKYKNKKMFHVEHGQVKEEI